MNKRNITDMKKATNRGIRYIGVLSSLLLVCSCAVYKTGFECSPGAGEGCKSVSQVNEMVSRGEIGRNLSIWQKREERQPLNNLNATIYKTKPVKTDLRTAGKIIKGKSNTTTTTRKSKTPIKAASPTKPVDTHEKEGCTCSKK